MREESELRQKYNQLLGRNLEKAFQKKLARKPHNCSHNYVHSSLTNKNNRIEVEHTGLCMLNADDPSSWEGNICETAADARFCPYFTARHQKQDVYDEFMAKISDPDILQHEFRDLHILRWALGEEQASPKLSFIDKIKFWITNYTWVNDKAEKFEFTSQEELDVLSKKLFQSNDD